MQRAEPRSQNGANRVGFARRVARPRSAPRSPALRRADEPQLPSELVDPTSASRRPATPRDSPGMRLGSAQPIRQGSALPGSARLVRSGLLEDRPVRQAMLQPGLHSLPYASRPAPSTPRPSGSAGPPADPLPVPPARSARARDDCPDRIPSHSDCQERPRSGG